MRALDFDVSCASCGYNLRGRPPLGRCPECGSHVGATIRAISRRERAIASWRHKWWAISPSVLALPLLGLAGVLLLAAGLLNHTDLPIARIPRVAIVDGACALFLALVAHWIVRAPLSWFLPMLLEVSSALLLGTAVFYLTRNSCGGLFLALVALPAVLIAYFTRVGPVDTIWFFVIIGISRVPQFFVAP